MDNDEIESIDEWPLIWTDVGDLGVCDDCILRNRMSESEPVTLPVWIKRGVPGTGCTKCKQKCRCLLLPDEILELYPTLRGETIKLRGSKKDHDYLKISDTIEYHVYRDLDDLVYQYEQLTPNLNLPESYYAIYDAEERISFLKDVILKIKEDMIDDGLYYSIKRRNREVKSRKDIRIKIIRKLEKELTKKS